MCTVISGSNCGCGGSTSSGVTAEGFLTTGAVLAAVAVGGAVFQSAWVLIGVALAIGWICAFPRSRRAAFIASALIVAGVLWLVRWYRKRLRQAEPAPAAAVRVVLPREYQAQLYLTRPGGRPPAVLRSGPVPGEWTNAADVAAEIKQRWLAVYGPPATGELVCHVQPVGRR